MALTPSEHFDSAVLSFLTGWFLIALSGIIPFLLWMLVSTFYKVRSCLATILASIASAECVLQGVLTLNAIRLQSRYDTQLNVEAIIAGTVAGVIFWNIAVKR